MTRKRTILPWLAAVTVAASLAACTPRDQSAPTDSGATTAAQTGSTTTTDTTTTNTTTTTAPVRLWTSSVHALSQPAATSHGFAFYAFTPARDFEVVSLDARTGRVRWRAPASPSDVPPGVVMKVNVVAGGALVVWQRPGKSYRDGEVTVAAADEVTGRVAWSYGADRLRLVAPPQSCRHDAAVCLQGYKTPGGKVSQIDLDARTGKVLADRALKGAEFFRSVSDGGLRDDDSHLVLVDTGGHKVWSRTFSSVFTGQDVTPDSGWNIELRDGRFIGSLGYRLPSYARPKKGKKVVWQLDHLSATAGFDFHTGRTLWVRGGDGVTCGQSLPFVPESPAVCRTKGTVTYTVGQPTPVYRGLDVTMMGVDPATGRTTWTWHAGNVPSLVVGSGGVIRLDDNRFAIRAGGGTTVLDLRSGAQASVGAAGWCAVTTAVRPGKQRQIAFYAGTHYSTEGWYPCDPAGKPAAVPVNAPKFAGTPVQGILAWADANGKVGAAAAPQN